MPLHAVDPTGLFYPQLLPRVLPAVIGSGAVGAMCTTMLDGGRRLLDWLLSEGAASETTIHEGQQGKHVPGHNNFQPGKSELTDPSPQDLLDRGAGTGQQVGNIPLGQPGSKERVDFGKNIGIYVDPVTGQRSPTNIGIIHNGSRGSHIVPARPGP